MKKIPFHLQLSEDVVAAMDRKGDRTGMSGNALAAALIYEFSRVPDSAVWEVIGLISKVAEEGATPAFQALPQSPKRGGRAKAAIPV